MKDLPDKVRILICVFNYDGWIRGEIADWYMGKCVPALTECGKVEAVSFTTQFRGYPITRLRNRACQVAQSSGFHYLLMIDNDNVPDCEYEFDPRARPFFPAALEFAISKGPCVVGAPYCGAPPRENCMVIKWEPVADRSQAMPATMTKYSRKEAAEAEGFEEVAALPTGMLLIDLRVLNELPPPWFDYEYKDTLEAELAATEDVFFTRNLSFVGVPQYVFWDAWAGHVKEVMVRRPHVPIAKEMPKPVRQAWELRAGLKLDTTK